MSSLAPKASDLNDLVAVLSYLQSALAPCEVSVALEAEALILKGYWPDGSRYAVLRRITFEELLFGPPPNLILERFVAEAKAQRAAQ